MSPRSLRFGDLVLYAVAMTLSLRWVATAAAAGPVSIALWIAAVAGFMGPLVIATAELTGRFPGEGGLYGWTGQTFGPFWGFLTGWVYWTCNLPFFSGLIYFTVNVLAAAGGPTTRGAAHDPAFFSATSIVLTLIVAVGHWRGLGVGKWLGAAGAVAGLALLALLVAAGWALAVTRGPATDFAAPWRFSLDADAAALWATMVFAFGGPEALAFLRDEVRGGLAQILRVLAVVAAVLAGAYVAGTLAMLAILAPGEASRLSGLPDALTLGLTRLGLGAAAPATLALLALSLLGGYSAWFGVAARLPFVIGVDSHLPATFARRDPRTGAPTTAIAVQTAAVIALILLSQAGASVRGAYDFLVSMSVLSYTLPFLSVFLVFLVLQGRAAPAGAWTAPGGPIVGRLIGLAGLLVTASAIACTLVPAADAPDKPAVVEKLLAASAVLVGAGAVVYALARRRGLRVDAP